MVPWWWLIIAVVITYMTIKHLVNFAVKDYYRRQGYSEEAIGRILYEISQVGKNRQA